MPLLKADLAACQGYANCVIAAPDTYDLDDDGVVVLLRTEFGEEELPRMREAARTCPASALTIEDA
ncbi:ferredoxin [Streptomyces griseiscabiei]|uniref:Ferredoxin n=1 Tax=Streptomyces griseiscabiei TaxID=2993540 RepID=A0ABU4LFK8_9ACTN|nr:ferredoxin [Streptomyces griseiscabiei]MBZ3900402.1 ferredoxin [Streptomyces griseiscabiei]MDX2914570.1 ferredoxin [Streptomyces griseiscabiei]